MSQVHPGWLQLHSSVRWDVLPLAGPTLEQNVSHCGSSHLPRESLLIQGWSEHVLWPKDRVPWRVNRHKSLTSHWRAGFNPRSEPRPSRASWPGGGTNKDVYNLKLHFKALYKYCSWLCVFQFALLTVLCELPGLWLILYLIKKAQLLSLLLLILQLQSPVSLANSRSVVSVSNSRSVVSVSNSRSVVSVSNSRSVVSVSRSRGSCASGNWTSQWFFCVPEFQKVFRSPPLVCHVFDNVARQLLPRHWDSPSLFQCVNQTVEVPPPPPPPPPETLLFSCPRPSCRVLKSFRFSYLVQLNLIIGTLLYFLLLSRGQLLQLDDSVICLC